MQFNNYCSKNLRSIWVVATLLGWILPLFYSGAKFGAVPFLPRYVAYQAACSGLFTKWASSWSEAAILGKHQGGTAWSVIPREVVSPMEIAGARQRLDRVITDTRRLKDRKPMLTRLAAHIASKYAERFPDQPRLVEVCLINTSWRTDDPLMMQPPGRWKIPPADALAKSHYSVLRTFQREGMRWVDAKKSPSPPSLAPSLPLTHLPQRPQLLAQPTQLAKPGTPASASEEFMSPKLPGQHSRAHGTDKRERSLPMSGPAAGSATLPVTGSSPRPPPALPQGLPGARPANGTAKAGVPQPSGGKNR